MPTKPPIGSASATAMAVCVPVASPSQCSVVLDVLQGLAQRAHGVLAHPAAIDVQHQLEDLLEQGDAGIGDGEPEDGLGGAVLDGVVDDPALQLERHAGQAEHAGRQHGERDLMTARAAHHVPHHRLWQDRALHPRQTPGRGRVPRLRAGHRTRRRLRGSGAMMQPSTACRTARAARERFRRPPVRVRGDGGSQTAHASVHHSPRTALAMMLRWISLEPA